MRIGTVDFGSKYILPASGAMNIHGLGYPTDRMLARLFPRRYTWRGTIPVMKTVTTEPRAGNMPINPETLMPLEFKPRCIRVSPFCETLNAVGLTNLGVQHHLEQGIWQQYQEPIIISWMGIGSAKEQVAQAEQFVQIMQQYLNQFRAPIVIEINLSCPNTGHVTADGRKMVDEALALIEIIAKLDVPLSVKFNLIPHAEYMAEVGYHQAVGNITLPNSTPWGTPGLGLNWNRIFPWYHAFGLIKDEKGMPRSPLYSIDKNGGGYSGPRVIQITCSRISDLRKKHGYRKNIIGGGAYTVRHMKMLFDAGANGIAVGSVKLHRPWRLAPMIGFGNMHGSYCEQYRATYGVLP